MIIGCFKSENEKKVYVIGQPDHDKTRLSEAIRKVLSEEHPRNPYIRGC